MQKFFKIDCLFFILIIKIFLVSNVDLLTSCSLIIWNLIVNVFSSCQLNYLKFFLFFFYYFYFSFNTKYKDNVQYYDSLYTLSYQQTMLIWYMYNQWKHIFNNFSTNNISSFIKFFDFPIIFCIQLTKVLCSEFVNGQLNDYLKFSHYMINCLVLWVSHKQTTELYLFSLNKFISNSRPLAGYKILYNNSNGLISYNNRT